MITLKIAVAADVEQLRCTPLDTDYNAGLRPSDDSITLANQHKEEGNRKYDSKDYTAAHKAYSDGLKLRGTIPNELAARLYANRSIVSLKLGYSDEALHDAEEATRLDPNWFKAHARVAACQKELRNFLAASAALERALALAPPDSRPELENELSECRLQHGRETRQEYRNLQYSTTTSAGRRAAGVASFGGKELPDMRTFLRMFDKLGPNELPGIKLLFESKLAFQERRFADHVALLHEAAEGHQVFRL